MAETLADTAARITCVACAAASGAVHVVSFDPLTVQPEFLLDETFESVNIRDEGPIAIFKKMAADLSPAGARAAILGQDIDTSKKISVFANFLMALLAQDAM